MDCRILVECNPQINSICIAGWIRHPSAYLYLPNYKKTYALNPMPKKRYLVTEFYMSNITQKIDYKARPVNGRIHVGKHVQEVPTS